MSALNLSSNIKRQINKYDFKDVGEIRCRNEAQTKVLLIEPFLTDILGYDIRTEVILEYDADFGDRTSKKVDYAITVKSNKPIILIEAKKYGEPIGDRHAGQLNNYFVNTPSAKIGILTNGIIYKFYLTSSFNHNILHPVPFLTFDVTDYSDSELEAVCKFHRRVIEPNILQAESDEKVFAGLFEKAFYEELCSPSDELLKSILTRIDSSQRLMPKMRERLLSLVNPFSVKGVSDRLFEDSSSGNTGIETTDEETKAYHFIKALLIQTKKFDSSRISFKDFKGHLNVICDDRSRNVICSLYFNSGNKRILIAGVEYELDTIEDIFKHKKDLISNAKTLML